MNAGVRTQIGWRLFCAAWGLTLVFRVALVLVGFRHLMELLPARERDAPPAFGRRVAAAVQAASRSVPGATCLVQACAALALLNLRGYTATLRVGVRQGTNGELLAHAWLLSRDCAIIGGHADEFQQYRRIADFG